MEKLSSGSWNNCCRLERQGQAHRTLLTFSATSPRRTPLHPISAPPASVSPCGRRRLGRARGGPCSPALPQEAGGCARPVQARSRPELGACGSPGQVSGAQGCGAGSRCWADPGLRDIRSSPSPAGPHNPRGSLVPFSAFLSPNAVSESTAAVIETAAKLKKGSGPQFSSPGDGGVWRPPTRQPQESAL